LATHNVSVQRESRATTLDELLAGHLLKHQQHQQQHQQQRHTGQNQTMASSTVVSMDGMLARFGELQQERHDQTVPLVNNVGLESVFAGLLSQRQRPNLEEWRVISQIPLDPRQQQQSQASILLASLDTDTLQSLMTGVPALAAQPLIRHCIDRSRR
jgi:hypothetical protein